MSHRHRLFDDDEYKMMMLFLESGKTTVGLQAIIY
jgi:hypothetical protein